MVASSISGTERESVLRKEVFTMEEVRKPPVSDKVEVRFAIPKALLELFVQQPRVVIKWRPDGLWPIGPDMLRKTDLLQKLAQDKEFNEQFEVVVMPRG